MNNTNNIFINAHPIIVYSVLQIKLKILKMQTSKYQLIINALTKLAKISPFDTVAVLYSLGLFNKFNSIISEANLITYANNFPSLYPDITTIVADKVALKCRLLQNEIDAQSRDNKYYSQIYADQLRKAQDYRCTIEKLKNKLNTTNTNLLANQNSPNYTEIYSKEYENITIEIALLTSQLKLIEADITPKNYQNMPTSSDKYNWNIQQSISQLISLAKSISSLINNPVPVGYDQHSISLYSNYCEQLLSLKTSFNNTYNILPPPFNANFKLYAISY